MSLFAGFAAGIAGMLILDGAAALLLPGLLRGEYAKRALADDGAFQARGVWLICSGVAGLLLLGAL